MSENKSIQLGLCCLNSTLRTQNPPIFSSRRMIIRSIKDKGIDSLKEKILHNLEDTLQLIDWNENNGIKVFRLSSELFPHKSNDKIEDYSFDFAKPLLEKIGERARYYNQRITFHPGQYNVVGTPNEKCFRQTINDLKYHADVLDIMGMDEHSVMVVHGGGIYGDKSETKKRWCRQFYLLPDNVQRRLVLENCEKCFSIEDCLDISSEINIPVVFDTHHFECYKLLHPEIIFKNAEDYIKPILNTWEKRQIKPKFHISEQGTGRIGHHSDYIQNIPDYLLNIPDKYNTNIDIMVEAKKKELAIFRLYKKYPFLNCLINNTKDLEASPILKKRKRKRLVIIGN